MATISIKPAELGTAVITLTFKNENGEIVAPISAEWQLMRTDGTIINNRSFDNGSLTGNQVVLTEDDLAIFGEEDSGKRIFSFQSVYNSSAGTNLPLNAEANFIIRKLLGQVDTP